MKDVFAALLKQPYWVIALFLGLLLIGAACTTVDKDNHLNTHGPTTYWLIGPGVFALVLSTVGLGFHLWQTRSSDDSDAGLDMRRVKEGNGALWTTVSGCEIRVVNGRIEDCPQEPGLTVVLPCNEFFDDRCASDTKSALGSYVHRVFKGQADEFLALMRRESRKQLGQSQEQQKTNTERAPSFGVGRCVLLDSPLNRSVPLALVSTTTQRAGEGLSAKISYLFDAMRDLATRLAGARLNEVAMPVLGSGHGGIDAPLAFVGLVLAVAEAARYGRGGKRLRRVTIIVFQADKNTPPEIDRLVVRRTLALIGSRD
jgi:Domain of unknown function (DUF6430)